MFITGKYDTELFHSSICLAPLG